MFEEQKRSFEDKKKFFKIQQEFLSKEEKEGYNLSLKFQEESLKELNISLRAQEILQETWFTDRYELVEKLVVDISKGMGLSNQHGPVPHIALARLVNNANHTLVYPLPYIFISSIFTNDTKRKMKDARIFQEGVAENPHIFAHVKSVDIPSWGSQFYAHSERAIFEKLLRLCEDAIDKKLLESSKYILQIKNSLRMCENCQRLWLNNGYRKSGKYDSSGIIIDVWGEVWFLSRIEVSRELQRITKGELSYNLAINFFYNEEQKREERELEEALPEKRKRVNDKINKG